VNDEQIIEYLHNRHRGNFDPPLGAVSTVMAAVDGAPSKRSWFASFMPAAAVAAIGAALVLAMLFGVGPNIGPGPGASEEASTIASPTPLPSSALPSPSPTRSGRPCCPLLQPGDTVSLAATDGEGEWGTIRLERGDDLGGYPDAEIPPDTFLIEVVVVYDAQRMPEPARFGRSDWAVRPSDPAADGSFVAEAQEFDRANGIGLRPSMPLGMWPGAADIFSTPTEGRIAFAIPRRAADLRLELVYQLGGQEQAFALRDPGTPPEPVAVATPQPTSEAAIAEAAAMAASLFADPDTCANPTDGYTLSFPDAWYTNTATGDVPACSWFTPEFFEVAAAGEPPEEIWISISVFDGQTGYTSLTEIYLNEQLEVDGRTAYRVEYNPNATTNPDFRGYHYVIPLGDNGPTLSAGTSTDSAEDYLLAKAVLDRIMASFEFAR
jgi:hypothetical protein